MAANNPLIFCQKWLITFALLMSAYAGAQQQETLEVVADTNQALIDTQQKVDNLSNATRALLQEYRAILQKTDYQQYYQFQLTQLQAEQEQQIASLEAQLEALDIIELTITPLMQSMLVALEEFVALDLPFKQLERLQAIQQLRSRVNSATLPLPDKYRLLLETWQIEHDYGRTIDTWRGALTDNGENLSVAFLRIGRVALYYRTLNGENQAVWDKQSKRWRPVPPTQFRALQRAYDVAASRIAPELLALPMVTQEVAP